MAVRAFMAKRWGLAQEESIDYEDYAHPEKLYKNLLLEPDPKNGKAEEPAQSEIVKRIKKMWTKIHASMNDEAKLKNQELCWSCGWTAYNELHSSYGSRIRIRHTRGCLGIWDVGSRWMVRDQPNDASLGNDFITQEFLRQQPGLKTPLIKEMRVLSEPTDKVVLTLMSKVPGVSLMDIWPTLPPKEKTGYADQLGECIKEWRQFTSPVAAKVNGEAMDDLMFGHCKRRRPPMCKKVGFTTEEWFKNLEPELRTGLSVIHKTKDPLIVEEKYQELIRGFPKSEPYVLTHGDLNTSNIMVKDGKIQAIIDWEMAGYLPWWAEQYLSVAFSNDPHISQLTDPLWAKIGQMDGKTFRREVLDGLWPVKQAWQAAEPYIQHSNNDSQWHRPGFCGCKDFGGTFLEREVKFEEHILTAEKKSQEYTHEDLAFMYDGLDLDEELSEGQDGV